jgi:hypothetical protein
MYLSLIQGFIGRLSTKMKIFLTFDGIVIHDSEVEAGAASVAVIVTVH